MKKLPDHYECSFEGTEVTCRYNTLCILDYPDEELAASNNPFASVVEVAKKALLEGRGFPTAFLSPLAKFVIKYLHYGALAII